MKFFKLTIYTFVFLISFSFFDYANAATEIIRTIKPSGQGGDYTTLAAWEAGEQRDLTAVDEIAVAQIDGNWSTPDTTAVTIDGWTTDVTHYIKIYTTEPARHTGKWDDLRYRLSTTANAIVINENEVRIDGLQIAISSDSSSRNTIYATGIGNVYISNNLLKRGGGAGSNFSGILFTVIPTAYKIYIYNNTIYDFNSTGDVAIQPGGSADSPAIYVYNNTIQNCTTGIQAGYNDAVAKNNLISSCSAAFSGTFNSGTDYNSTDNGSMGYTVTGGGNTHDRISQTFSFADESNDDFHLNSTDTGAKNFGVDLSGDANLPFSDDIDGQVRSTSSGQAAAWDIGADEVGGNTRVVFSPDLGQETNFGAATAIYRSVGPGNTTALAVGASNTLTISGSTATFSSPLPDRIGVGDALQYDDDNDSDIDADDSIVFIHSRTDSKTFTVKTASGGVPTAVSGDTDWSLFRAYTSLSLAEAGTENTGIDSDLRNFDTWTNGKDIATSNEVWNIAAYGDATDTTAVVIDGWTTDADNYIRIYTPVSKEEVGVSQRHRGKWDAGKYNLVVTNSAVLRTSDAFIRIDGLQVKLISNNTSNYYVISSTTGSEGGTIEVSNNIVTADLTGATAGTKYGIAMEVASVFKIWNNIVYDFSQAGVSGMGIRMRSNSGTMYAYNNTSHNNTIGIEQSLGTLIAKNNIVKGSGNTSAYGGAFAVGTDYNATDGTDNIGQGANNRTSQVFIFADEANDDFHLFSTDTGAKNHGADLTNDADLPFSTDIDGQSRPTGVNAWDIGADERQANTVIKGGIKITK